MEAGTKMVAVPVGEGDLLDSGGNGGVNMPEAFPSDLPPRAQNLLEAAHRLLIAHGYEGLSWAKIAKEAGEQKSTIGYYFGDKASLVLELLRLMGRDSTTWMVRQVEEMPQGADKISAFLSKLRGVTGRPESMAFFDVLPHAIREEDLRGPVAELYAWYCLMTLKAFGLAEELGADPKLEALGWLFIAACDGILIQRALAPEHYPVDEVYAKLELAMEYLVESCLKDRESMSS